MKTLNELAKELHHVVTSLVYLPATDPAQQRLAGAIKHFASRAAEVGQQGLWQPIETLDRSQPADLLVAHAGRGWVSRACIMQAEGLVIIGGQWQPTHWQPLPLAPAS